MATRDEDDFFNQPDNKELFDIIDRQYTLIQRIQKAENQVREIQTTIQEGPHSINKIMAAIKYDRDLMVANRKRIYDLMLKKPSVTRE